MSNSSNHPKTKEFNKESADWIVHRLFPKAKYFQTFPVKLKKDIDTSIFIDKPIYYAYQLTNGNTLAIDKMCRIQNKDYYHIIIDYSFDLVTRVMFMSNVPRYPKVEIIFNNSYKSIKKIKLLITNAKALGLDHIQYDISDGEIIKEQEENFNYIRK